MSDSGIKVPIEKKNGVIGRPPLEFNPQVAELICLELSNGKSLRQIQREYDQVPSFHSIYKWLASNPTFAEQYRKAREYQADSYLDMIMEVSLDTSEDITFNKEGNPVTNNKAINRARLITDNMKWVMGKLNGKYSDRQIVEHQGNRPGGVTINVDTPPKETREEWERRMRKKIELRGETKEIEHKEE